MKNIYHLYSGEHMSIRKYRITNPARPGWYQIVYKLNGQLHNENDLPAVESVNGMKKWYRYGVLHRKMGPAVEFADGYKEWWINGEFVKFEGESKYRN